MTNDNPDKPLRMPADAEHVQIAISTTPAELSILDIGRFLVRGRWQIAAIVLAASAIATLMAFTMTKVYRAETLLAPVHEEEKSQLSSLVSQLGGFASIAGVNFPSEGSSITALATLESRVFTEEFLREQGVLQILFADEWDQKTQQWKSYDPKKNPTYWRAFKLFDEEIRQVSQDPETGLVTLSIEWTDSNLAAEWANELVMRLNSHLRNLAVRESEKSLNFLRNELNKIASVEVRESVFGLIEIEMKKAMLATIRDEFAFRIIDPAISPEEPIRPQRILIIGLGLLLGGVFACFWVISRALLMPVTEL